jgi:hypothetical protein
MRISHRRPRRNRRRAAGRLPPLAAGIDVMASVDGHLAIKLYDADGWPIAGVILDQRAAADLVLELRRIARPLLALHDAPPEGSA